MARAAFCLSRLRLWSCGRQGPCTPAAPFPSSPPYAFSPRDAFRAVWGGEVCGTRSSVALGTIHVPIIRALARKVAKGVGMGASERSYTWKILQENKLHLSAVVIE